MYPASAKQNPPPWKYTRQGSFPTAPSGSYRVRGTSCPPGTCTVCRLRRNPGITGGSGIRASTRLPSAAIPGLSAPPGTTNRFMGGQPFARGYLRSRQIFQAAAPRARADAHLTVVFINKASLETFSRSLWLLQRFLQTFCGGRVLKRGALSVAGFEIEPAQLTYPS